MAQDPDRGIKGRRTVAQLLTLRQEFNRNRRTAIDDVPEEALASIPMLVGKTDQASLTIP